MKKRFYRVSSLLLGSFITLLGMGSCKCTKNLDNVEAVYGPPPGYEEEMEKARAEYERAEQERQLQEQQLREKQRRDAERFKTVYGPPPARKSKVLYMPDAEGVYDVVEQMPQFPGGDVALSDWIAGHQKVKGDGRVIVSFIVETDGSLNGLIVKKSVSPELDREALRLVREMPKWKAGKQNGQPVRVKYMLPVTFEPK